MSKITKKLPNEMKLSKTQLDEIHNIIHDRLYDSLYDSIMSKFLNDVDDSITPAIRDSMDNDYSERIALLEEKVKELENELAKLKK